jgi:hypothetical protein
LGLTTLIYAMLHMLDKFIKDKNQNVKKIK